MNGLKKLYGSIAWVKSIFVAMQMILSVPLKCKDAERFYKSLSQRLERFGLQVAEDKTRIIEFSHCKVRVKPKFDFLGFECRWGVNRWENLS